MVDLAVASQVIVVSPSCLSSSCTTIDDLILPTQGNVTLVFEPGTHTQTLNGSLTFMDRQNDHISFVGTPGDTTVECTSPNPTSDQFLNNAIPSDYSFQQVGSVSITGITFSDCRLVLAGGDSVSIAQSAFTRSIYDTLIISDFSAVTMEQVTISDARPDLVQFGFAGVVNVSQCGNVELSHCLITRNVVRARSIIQMEENDVSVVSNCSFHDNLVILDNPLGVIFLLLTPTVSVSDCSFQNNSVGSQGFVVAIRDGSVNVTTSTFTGNRVSLRSAILVLSSTNAQVTRSNFTGNVVDSRGIIQTFSMSGFISCCYFQKNSVGSGGGIIRTVSGMNSIYVTNSTFTENAASSGAGIIHVGFQGSNYVGVVSSVFTFNRVNSSEGIIISDSSATGLLSVFASDFSHNTAPAIRNDASGIEVTVDCTHFYNNSGNVESSQQINIKNTTFCLENYALGQQGACASLDCDGKAIINVILSCINNSLRNSTACGPPNVPGAVEYSTYTVSEGVHYALQVCAVVTTLMLPVDITIHLVNGTALGECVPCVTVTFITR